MSKIQNRYRNVQKRCDFVQTRYDFVQNRCDFVQNRYDFESYENPLEIIILLIINYGIF